MSETKLAESTVTVSVSAPGLRKMLTAVLPHAGEDDTLPGLNGVRFEVASGTLFLIATDRYTIGVARCPVPGAKSAPVADRAATLWLRDALELRQMLEAPGQVAAVTLGGKKLTVDAGKCCMAGWVTDTAQEFPDWRNLLSRLLAGEPAQLGDDQGINAVHLAKFALPDEGDDRTWCASSLRLRILKSGEPVILVTRDDWFLGALMPTRVHGLPDAPSDGARWDMWAAITAPAAGEAPEVAAGA